MTKKLSDLKLGDIAKIIGLDGISELCREKLMAFGLIPGARLTVLREAPFGGPLQIQLDDDLVFSMRKAEGQDVQVELA